MEMTKKDTTNIIEIGTDGSLHNLSISSSFGLYAKSLEELDKCDYIDKSTKLYTKDEVILMLTELDLQIDELAAYNLEVAKVQRLIRDKINALKGDPE